MSNVLECMKLLSCVLWSSSHANVSGICWDCSIRFWAKVACNFTIAAGRIWISKSNQHWYYVLCSIILGGELCFSTIEISLFLSENRHGPRIPKVCSGSANELQWYEDLSLFSSHLSHGFLDIPQLYGGGPLNKDAGNFLTSKGVPIFVFYGSYVKFLTHLKTVSGWFLST